MDNGAVLDQQCWKGDLFFRKRAFFLQVRQAAACLSACTPGHSAATDSGLPFQLLAISTPKSPAKANSTLGWLGEEWFWKPHG